jgi:two-component system cell cycle sensor histidine kinase/response regulator CckA
MSETLRVLQVEDSESDAALMARILAKAGYDLHAERVDDPEAMRDALARAEWDVIIADHRMGPFDAPGALRVLHETGRDIPFIVVSGSIGEELAVTMMKSGAHDYLLKNNLTRLVPAVEREIREARSRRDRVRAEMELRDSQERLALAIEATQLGMFDFAPRTGKLVWSELTRLHFGLPPNAEVTYEIFLRGIHADDRERVDRTIQDLLRAGSDGHFAIEYRTIGIEDRLERFISSWGRVFYDPHLAPVRLVGVTLDITARKTLEEQFRQAQKLEGIGRLAGGVAHDFNNLLTVISGYSQMVLADLSDHDPLRDGVEEISKAANRASNLTRQLLTFSRRNVRKPAKILLNDVVGDFRKMLDRLIGEDIEVVVSLDPKAGSVHADPGEIEQVIMNLAVNARDAMPGGGKLLIETAPFMVDDTFAQSHLSVAKGGYAMLAVSDTGTGMSSEVQSHIFEPFYTTKDQGKGTGLGLSTVYGIVTQAGGTIMIHSEPGRGSSFRILLPAAEEETEAEPGPDAELVPAGSETILLAEDEPGVRKYIQETLSRRGYTVLLATNGREAMLVAQQHPGPIHLLLADAVMPEMTGVQLMREFGAVRPGVPMACISGYSHGTWQGEQLPANYIQKPFTASQLLQRVRQMLDASEDASTGSAE